MGLDRPRSCLPKVLIDNTEAQAIHLRLLAGDPTASYDCVVFWQPILERHLNANYAPVYRRDPQMIEAAALEAIFNYTAAPYKYNPERSGLGTYMQLSARGDLLNALSREKTESAKASSLDAVELFVSDGKNLEESALERIDAGALWEKVMLEITEPLDRQVLVLMLTGERTTAAFADVLGVSYRPETEQKAIVKRCKDRLSKRLTRLGDHIRG
ncbi:MAG: hypothetical protein ABI670_16060 [Chloroflexota bacterium]